MNKIGADKCQNADAACRSLPDRKLHGDCLAAVETLRNNNEVVDRGARILLELDLHDVLGDDVTLKAYLDRGKMLAASLNHPIEYERRLIGLTITLSEE